MERDARGEDSSAHCKDELDLKAELHWGYMHCATQD